LGLFAVSPHAIAQQIEVPPVQSAPAPRDFQLRPGPQNPPESSNVQGPVDEESTPPRRINPDAPAPRPLPDTSRPVEQIPAITAPRVEQLQPPQELPQPIENPVETSSDSGSSVAPEVLRADPIPAQNPNPLPYVINDTPKEEKIGTSISNWPIYAGFLALLIALLGIFMWRRQSRRAVVYEGEEPDDIASEPAETPAATPQPTREKSAPPVVASPRPAPPTGVRSGPVMLEFIPSRAETTLFNAIIAYRLTVINTGDKPIRNIAVHALVEQARRDMMQQIPALEGADLLPLRHNHDLIEAGSSQLFEGELRLPLNTIEPIQVSSRYLFVPVTHFWIGYTEPDGQRFAATRSFLVGEEANPPTAKVAPIRLELGPRKIMTVGQRPLIAA